METLTEERPAVAPAEPSGPPGGRLPTALLPRCGQRSGSRTCSSSPGSCSRRSSTRGPQVVDALLTFIAFCAISSAGYLVNDLRDAPLDRRHPEKRNRPIASGELSRGARHRGGRAGDASRSALALGLRLEPRSPGSWRSTAYHLAYSLVLKRLVIIDVMTIASLFILRVVAGAVAVDAHASEWLILCTAMLALFLGFTKRRQEAILEHRREEDGETRPVLEHYSLPFLDQMVAMVTAGGVISYAIYAVNSPLIGTKMLATAPSSSTGSSATST